MKKLCKPILLEYKEFSIANNDTRVGMILQHSETNKLHFGVKENNHGMVATTICKDDYEEWNGKLIPQQLILISLEEEEKIRYGDKWIYVCPINGIDYGDSNEAIVTNTIPDSYNWFDKLHDKKNYHKVIATQEQLSPEYIQQFIEEYNKGDVKNVEVEFWDNSDYNPSMLPDIRPKLTNRFVTITSKEKKNSLCNGWDKLSEGDMNIILPRHEKVKAPITYIEEEVYNLTAYAHSHGYSLCLGTTNDLLEFPEWWDANKKK